MGFRVSPCCSAALSLTKSEAWQGLYEAMSAASLRISPFCVYRAICDGSLESFNSRRIVSVQHLYDCRFLFVHKQL